MKARRDYVAGPLLRRPVGAAETEKGPLARDPFFVSLARPERFELPTFWFVGRLGFCRFFQFKKLDGPPSLYVPPSLAKSRRVRIQPYACAVAAHLLSTRSGLSMAVARRLLRAAYWISTCPGSNSPNVTVRAFTLACP